MSTSTDVADLTWTTSYSNVTYSNASFFWSLPAPADGSIRVGTGRPQLGLGRSRYDENGFVVSTDGVNSITWDAEGMTLA